MSKETLTNANLARELEELGLQIPTTFDGEFDRDKALAMRKAKLAEKAAEEKLQRKVRVIFNHSTNPNAGSYVFGSVNHHNFQAPYGIEVDIPEFLLRGAIDNAKTVTWERVSRPGGTEEIVRKETPVYPYTFIGYVEDLEKAAA